MSDIIDTTSRLFKLYAARRVRKGPCWNVEDVLDHDTETINVCSYARNITLEILYHVMIALGKLVGGLIVGFLLMVPILSIGAWLLTDNPFIIWFGDLGQAVMGIDAVLIACAVFVTVGMWFDEHPINVKKRAKSAITHMSVYGLISKWIKGKHDKVCHRLKFDRETKNPTSCDEQYPDWPRE